MAKKYGQFCPVAKAAEIMCERWTALIIRDLSGGPRRFSELKRGVPLMSPTLLSHRIKQLIAEDVVARRRSPSGSGWIYQLTPAGKDFAPVILALGTWGQQWSRRQLEEGEIDYGLLIWALEQSVHPEAFGPGRTVVRLEFTDLPQEKKLWWFVNESGACHLCLEEPGYEVDLYLAASVADMVYIWRGDLALGKALETDRLEAIGRASARRALRGWLGISVLAHVQSKRVDAVPA